jgi:hypothetical protein
MWLIKVVVVIVVLAVLFGALNGWRNAKIDLAASVERETKLQDQIVVKDATAGQLRKEKDEILAESAGLKQRYKELEKKVGKLTVTGTIDVSTPTGGATAHGTPRDEAKPPIVIDAPAQPYMTLPLPALLRVGDKGHIRMLALSLETKAGNSVLLAEGICYRDVPGPVDTEILRDTARVDLSEVLRRAPPRDPGVGIGPLVAGGKGLGVVYGAMVSPATINFTLIWSFQTELLLGGAANANGDWLGMGAALLRLR